MKKIFELIISFLFSTKFLTGSSLLLLRCYSADIYKVLFGSVKDLKENEKPEILVSPKSNVELSAPNLEGAKLTSTLDNTVSEQAQVPADENYIYYYMGAVIVVVLFGLSMYYFYGYAGSPASSPSSSPSASGPSSGPSTSSKSDFQMTSPTNAVENLPFTPISMDATDLNVTSFIQPKEKIFSLLESMPQDSRLLNPATYPAIFVAGVFDLDLIMAQKDVGLSVLMNMQRGILAEGPHITPEFKETLLKLLSLYKEYSPYSQQAAIFKKMAPLFITFVTGTYLSFAIDFVKVDPLYYKEVILSTKNFIAAAGSIEQTEALLDSAMSNCIMFRRAEVAKKVYAEDRTLLHNPANLRKVSDANFLEAIVADEV